MQKTALATVLGALVALAAPAHAQVFQPVVPTLGPPPMSSVTTINSGNMSFSNGMVGGTPYSSNTQYMGNMAITNGTIGGAPFSSTTTNLGGVSTTTVTP